MKAFTLRLVPLAVLSTGLAIFAGCNKQDQADAKTTVADTYDSAKASAAKAWDNVKDYTYDKRSDFSAQAKTVSSQLDADVAKLQANYSDAQASASRKAAMADLKSSQADYKQKLDALGSASADTWDSAKKNVIASWDKLQASYYKARAN